MKNIFTKFAFAFIAIFTLTTMTSCEEDEYIARTLEGTWVGNLYEECTFDGMAYETVKTEVTFLKDPYRYAKGDGYWVDYVRVGRTIRPYSNHMYWEVSNGRIIIDLVEDRTTLYIRDYDLNDYNFRGEYSTDNRTWGEFNLYHIDSPNYGGYEWGVWGDYYYAKTRSNNDEPVKVVRKMKEQQDSIAE